jgi:hypothetical protein
MFPNLPVPLDRPSVMPIIAMSLSEYYQYDGAQENVHSNLKEVKESHLREPSVR